MNSLFDQKNAVSVYLKLFMNLTHLLLAIYKTAQERDGGYVAFPLQPLAQWFGNLLGT